MLVMLMMMTMDDAGVFSGEGQQQSVGPEADVTQSVVVLGA